MAFTKSTVDIRSKIDLLDIELMYLRRSLMEESQSSEEIHRVLLYSTDRINDLNRQLNDEADKWITAEQLTTSQGAN